MEMGGAFTVDPIPLLTPYKMGKFNLSHRYICNVHTSHILLYLQFLYISNFDTCMHETWLITFKNVINAVE
jgi:hypothetical protein